MNNIYDKDGLMITEKHVFFYKNKCPFSNFYQPCSFLYTVWPEGMSRDLVSNTDCHRFFSSEQAFMYHKARFFNDNETALKILNDGNLSPKFCKEQGRLVKNYDDKAWSKVRYRIFLDINMAKFMADADLQKFILDPRFEGKMFVEASPYDAIWGIHMSIEEPGIDDEKNWKGQNLLGKVITQVRDNLKNIRIEDVSNQKKISI